MGSVISEQNCCDRLYDVSGGQREVLFLKFYPYTVVFSKVHNVEHTSLRIFNLLFLALSLPNVVLKGKKKIKRKRRNS